MLKEEFVYKLVHKNPIIQIMRYDRKIIYRIGRVLFPLQPVCESCKQVIFMFRFGTKIWRK